MAFQQIYSISAVTVGASELSVISGTTSLQADTTDAVIQCLFDGVAAGMAKGDEFIIRIYEKVLSGSTKRQIFSLTLSDAQAEPVVTPQLLVMHGWDVTIQKVNGTDRAWDASVRAVT